MTDASVPVALVSGSRGGIGNEVVRALSAEGFRVVGVDRATDGEGLADLELTADITNSGECEAAVEATLDAMSRLDVLVNGAGVNLRQPFAELDTSRARELFDVNVWGTVNLTQAARKPIIQSPCASVVVLTSINGELGIAGGAAYGMSKAALGALVRVLAVEWASIPVRVNAVSPAIVPTAMNAAVRADAAYLAAKLEGLPIGRMIETTEVADAVAFLAGNRSSGITGETLHVDGGAVIKG